MNNSKSIYLVIISVMLMLVSCKKDYQKLSTEFIRNLPDTCTFLVQVDNEVEEVVERNMRLLVDVI